MGAIKIKTVRKYGMALRSAVISVVLIFSVTSLALLGNAMGIDKNSIIMFYLLGVLFASLLTGSYVFGLISAVANGLLFNYLFTEPRFTLHIKSGGDVVLLLFFLMTAVTGSTMMSRLKKQMELATQNEAVVRMLYEISGGFLHLTGRQNIIMRGISYIREYTGCVSRVKIDGDEDDYAEYIEGFSPVAGQQSIYDIVSPVGKMGKLTVYISPEDVPPKQELIFKTVATQIGISLEREAVYHERENIRIAMEREKLRSTLLRAVSHDLRTPLTALSGASSLLSDRFAELSDNEKHELVCNIGEEIIWLTNLVENILNMTRIDASQLVIRKEYEVIDDIVSEALRHMRRLTEGRRIVVTLPDEVVALPMDGKLIAQVLINLIDNAIKHTSGGNITLDASVDGDYVRFAVADNGIGIAPENRESIFSHFVTSMSAMSDGKQGIGLGLAICRAIVEGHGGKIWVEENVPKGSKFVFILPLEA